MSVAISTLLSLKRSSLAPQKSFQSFSSVQGSILGNFLFKVCSPKQLNCSVETPVLMLQMENHIFVFPSIDRGWARICGFKQDVTLTSHSVEMLQSTLDIRRVLASLQDLYFCSFSSFLFNFSSLSLGFFNSCPNALIFLIILLEISLVSHAQNLQNSQIYTCKYQNIPQN